MYFAHTAELQNGEKDNNKKNWQPLRDHLLQVAEQAKAFADIFGCGDEAYLAGLLHDLGKYSARFQKRLCNPSSVRGVNHWASGAVICWKKYKSPVTSFTIDGHHTGIPSHRHDMPCLKDSLIKFKNDDLKNIEGLGIDESINELLECLENDNIYLPSVKNLQLYQNENLSRFAVSLKIRMLFSCLVDADFLDTEKHFEKHLHLKKSDQRNPPDLRPKKALEILLTHLEQKSSNTSVNKIRKQLLDNCLVAAEKEPGLYTLTAPTGSGKTFSSLAFALKHAHQHNLRRIIVVIPYTSIIEQTAQVYRALFEPHSGFGSNYVLEHHSAVIHEENKKTSDDKNEDSADKDIRYARLAAENWDAPLIVTTSVQFFESLFSNRPSSCRKLHNIANSVIFFDEVQTLPISRIPSLLSAVNLLVKQYKATALFGTATQPAFASADKYIDEGWKPTEINKASSAMAEALQRVSITYRKEPISWETLAKAIQANKQALCVVNTRKDALALFERLPQDTRFHLSTSMCPAHRKDKLEAIKTRLSQKKPCLLVSTQLIEAGVDIDFPTVYRAIGPFDSIIQSAGRCNREGHLSKRAPVIIFNPKDGDVPPGAYEKATQVTKSFLEDNPEIPFHQPESYKSYFERLYSFEDGTSDIIKKESEALNFPEVNKQPKIILDKNSYPVLVRYNKGEDLIEKIKEQKYIDSNLLRACQPYTIILYANEWKDLRDNGTLAPLFKSSKNTRNDIYYLNGKYNLETGIKKEYQLADFLM